MTEVLGLDLGTQGAKAVLLDPTGQVIGAAVREYPVLHPTAGAAEQHPAEWWDAIVACCAELRERHPTAYAGVGAVGLSGQMHGVVLLDDGGQPLRPAILWSDTRGAEDRHRVAAVVANHGAGPDIVPTVAAYSAVKLRWIQRNEPAVWASARQVLWSKDLLRHWLTGGCATDPTDASGTQLFDLRARAWDASLAESLGIDSALLPPIREPADTAGELSDPAAKDLQLEPGLPVATGAGDLACGLLGTGVVRPGDTALIAGTAGQVLTVHDALPTWRPGAFPFAYLRPDTWFTLSALPAAGSALRWFADRIDATVDSLGRLGRTSRPGANGLLFLPHLAGSGSPRLDDRARGAFLGLDAAHGTADLARAVLEGVAYGLRMCLDVSGHQPGEPVRLTGGVSQDEEWCQLLADVTGSPIVQLDCPYSSGTGAGLLGGLASGAYPNLTWAADRFIGERVFEPDTTAAVRYAELSALYREADRLTADLTARLGAHASRHA